MSTDRITKGELEALVQQAKDFQMKVKWTYTGTMGRHDRTSGYEFRSRTGRFYTRTVSQYSGVTITRWPSEQYYVRNLLGQNKGTLSRTWHRE